MEICPHMGSHWDSETPFTSPDPGNRCFAKSEPVRVFLLFSREILGVRIQHSFQQSNCYGNFGSCEYFQARQFEKDTEQAPSGREL